MSTTFADQPSRKRHLAAVGGTHAATAQQPGTWARPAVSPLLLLQVARAEKFAVDTERLVAGSDPVRAGVLLGQALAHLDAACDAFRVVTGTLR